MITAQLLSERGLNLYFAFQQAFASPLNPKGPLSQKHCNSESSLFTLIALLP